jgi:hypothetical protein
MSFKTTLYKRKDFRPKFKQFGHKYQWWTNYWSPRSTETSPLQTWGLSSLSVLSAIALGLLASSQQWPWMWNPYHCYPVTMQNRKGAVTLLAIWSLENCLLRRAIVRISKLMCKGQVWIWSGCSVVACTTVYVPDCTGHRVNIE